MNSILNKKTLYNCFRIILLVLSIYMIFKIVDFKLVLNYLVRVPLFIIIIILIMHILRLWLTGLRWRLLNPDITGQLNSWHYFRFVMIAHTFNLVMPGALGGDFVKTAFTLSTIKHKRIDNVIAILVDRFVGIMSILVLGTIAFFTMSTIPNRTPFNLFWSVLYGSIFIFVVLMVNSHFHRVLSALFSRLGKIGLWLNKFLKVWQESLKYFIENNKRVIMALLLCLPIHIVSFASAYILACNLNIGITFFDITLVIAMVWVVTAIPITISGVGVRELSMIYFLSFYGVNPESATALSIYLYIVTILLGLLGLLFMFDLSKIIRKKDRGFSK